MRATKPKPAAPVLSPARSAIAAAVRALEALDRLDRADFPYWAAHRKFEGMFTRPAQIAAVRAVPDLLGRDGYDRVSRMLRDLCETAQASAADAVRPGIHADQLARAVAHACAARVFTAASSVLWEDLALREGLFPDEKNLPRRLADNVNRASSESDECVKAVAIVVKHLAQTAEDWRRP